MDRLYLAISSAFFLAGIIYAVLALTSGRYRQSSWNLVAIGLGFIFQTLFLYARGQVHGRCPISSLGEILIFLCVATCVPGEFFMFEGRMGALNIDRLGNASPREVDVRFRMGEASLELEGEWLNDSVIKMKCSMGECGARVPSDVFVELDADAVMGGRNVRLPDQTLVPEGAPTLSLDLTASMGEVRVR